MIRQVYCNAFMVDMCVCGRHCVEMCYVCTVCHYGCMPDFLVTFAYSLRMKEEIVLSGKVKVLYIMRWKCSVCHEVEVLYVVRWKCCIS